MCLKAVLAHREQGERGEGRHWIAYLKVQNIWWKTDSASAHILQGDQGFAKEKEKVTNQGDWLTHVSRSGGKGASPNCETPCRVGYLVALVHNHPW